jgi:hypothetical protein
MDAEALTAAFARGMRKVYGTRRGDDRYLHVADVKGCQIATHARLRGKPMLSASVETLVKWQLGHAGEAIMAGALEPELVAQGYAVERDALLWMAVAGDRLWSGRLNREEYPARLITAGGQHLIPARTIVGHADLIATRRVGDAVERILIEAKTERRKLGAEPSWLHSTQAAAYALMDAGEDPAGSCVVGIIDVRGGDYIFHNVDVAAVRSEIIALAARAIAVYAEEPAPDTEPPIAAMCTWCDYGGCARNRNTERLSLEGIF